MMRVLEVVTGMNVGGLEMVVKNILEYSKNTKVLCECLICDLDVQDYENELLDLGIKIHKIPKADRFKTNLYKKLKEFFQINPYDVVHVHMAFSNGVVAKAAKECGVNKVICHSHGVELPNERKFIAKVYQLIMRRYMKRYSDLFLACSNAAGQYLFGKKVFQSNGKVFANGILCDLYRYDSEQREKKRKELNTQDKIVLGTVGSLVPVKNQTKLIEIAQQIDNSIVLLVGDGPCKEKLREYAYEKNVECIFAGKQRNIQDYLQAMDVFIFPSSSEGFGIALLEAQANGLPCVVSDAIQSEVKILEKIYTVKLDEPIDKWVLYTKKAYKNGRTNNIEKIICSPFNLRNSMETLFQIYLDM